MASDSSDEPAILVSDAVALLNSVIWGLVPASILYGFYSLLVFFCLNNLRRTQNLGFKWQMIFVSILYTLITCYIVARVTGVLLVLNFQTSQVQSGILKSTEFLTDTVYLVADSVLVYRCYLIWNRRKLIGLFYIPLLAAFVVMTVANSSNAVGSGLSSTAEGVIVFYSITLTVNISILALAAGRLLRLRVASVRLMTNFKSESKQLLDRYTFALNLMLESGSLYILILIITFALRVAATTPALFLQVTFATVTGAFISVSVVLAGFLPTLMLWRVANGHDSTTESIKSLNSEDSYKQTASY